MKTNDYKKNFFNGIKLKFNLYVYNIYEKIKLLKNLIIEFKKLLNEKINKPLVISGPSAVGKDTMINRLIIKYPDVINKLPSYTTRPKREGEIEGKDYYFVSKEKFLKMKDEGKLFGIQEYNNNFYASNKKELKDALEENKKIIILNYNIETAYAVKDEIDFNFVALLPPNEDELRKRLIKRKTKTEEIEDRMANSIKEISLINEANFINYRLVNDDEEMTFNKLEKYLKEIYPQFFN